MAYLRRFWVKTAPSFRNRYRQKEVYLNMAYSRRFWVKEPRHSETVIARKSYTLIWRIPDDLGLRSPVIQKTLLPERGIPYYGVFTTILGSGAPSFRKRYRQKEVYLNMAYLRRFWVKKPRHSETDVSDEKCYLCRSTRQKEQGGGSLARE